MTAMRRVLMGTAATLASAPRGETTAAHLHSALFRLRQKGRRRASRGQRCFPTLKNVIRLAAASVTLATGDSSLTAATITVLLGP